MIAQFQECFIAQASCIYLEERRRRKKERDKEGVIGREKRGKEIVENRKGGRKGE